MKDWQGFFQKRKEQALRLLEVGGENEDPMYPFDSSEYIYADVLDEYLDSSMRRMLMNSNPADIVTDNPFEQSKHAAWPSVWDAAVGLPASKMRGDKVYTIKTLPIPRHINDTWQNKTMIDLSHIGRVTPESEYRRPSGNWILDLVSDTNGWKLMELAHMLAHKAEDEDALSRRPRPYSYGQNCSLFHSMLFKVFMCRKFNKPIDVEMSSDDPDTQDMFDRFKIISTVGTELRNPVLRISADGRDCIKPGSAICVVCGSVHIEPTPHAAATGTDRWLEMNRWSCEPTITAFAGWELVDVVMHAPLTYRGRAGGSCDYTLTPPALQEASTFENYLACAADNVGDCVADNKRYWLVDEYIQTKRFEEDLLKSPPLPCKRCFKLNMQSDGSPMRPKSERPERKSKGQPTEAQREWDEWDARMEKIFGIVETATRFMELRENGALKARTARKTRKRAYNKRVNNLRRARYLAGRVKKLRQNGYMQAADELEDKIKQLGVSDAT